MPLILSPTAPVKTLFRKAAGGQKKAQARSRAWAAVIVI
jgi:hypothetical protein